MSRYASSVESSSSSVPSSASSASSKSVSMLTDSSMSFSGLMPPRVRLGERQSGCGPTVRIVITPRSGPYQYQIRQALGVRFST